MQLFKTPNIKWLKYKYIALAITAGIVAAGILNVTVFKGLKLGVDFGEGTLLRIMFKSPKPVGEIRDQLRRVGLGNSSIQEIGDRGQDFQIRTMEVVNIKDSDQEQMEAHEALANQVIEALRGEEGRSQTEKGLADLNSIDEIALASLLESSFPGSGPESARQIISYRNNNGIISDFEDLRQAGISQETLDYLQQTTFLGNLTIQSRETVGPRLEKTFAARLFRPRFGLSSGCSSTSPSASSSNMVSPRSSRSLRTS